MRMHGQKEHAAFLPRTVELPAENLLHRRRRRVGAQRGEAMHVEIHGIVADPFGRQFHDPGRLAIGGQLIGVVVAHQGTVVEQPHLPDDPQRVDREIPAGRAHPDRRAPGQPFQNLGGAQIDRTLRLIVQVRVLLVDPGMQADLVAVLRHRAHLILMQQGGDAGVEEGRGDGVPRQKRADARHALARAVLALADPHRAGIAVAQRDGFVIRVERQRHGAASAIGPMGWLEAAARPGAFDHAAPGRLGPFPRSDRVRHDTGIHPPRSAGP